MLRLPHTTVRVSSPQVDAELLQLLGVVPPVQQVPLPRFLRISRFWPADLLGTARSTFSSRTSSSSITRMIYHRTLLRSLSRRRRSWLLCSVSTSLCEIWVTLIARQLHVVARVAAGSAHHFALHDQGVLDAPEHLLVSSRPRARM